MNQQTPQQKMQALLEQSGLPYKEVRCYGSQIMVTCWSYAAVPKWVTLLGQFATVKSTAQGVDYRKADAHLNRPKQLKVWRVWATLGGSK
jgi:hypothetical protein